MQRLQMTISLILGAALMMATSCKQIVGQSASKDLKPGIMLNERTKDPKKAQALIYYANNPVQTGSYASERRILIENFNSAAKINTNKAKQISNAQSRFARDYDEFSTAVNMDMERIKAALCRSDAPTHAGVIFITNAGITGQSLQYCEPGQSIKPLSSDLAQKFYNVYNRIKVNPIYEHSPLSHVDMFNAALIVSAALFPADKYEYSLVLKSHGSEEMTITPKIAYESKLVTAPMIAGFFASRPETRAIANSKSLDKDGLDKDGLDKDGLDKDGLDKDGLDKDGLDKDGLDKDGLDKDGLEAKSDKIIQGIRAAGISKAEMMSMIMDPSHKMYFNVLFLESCKSDLGMLLMELSEYDYSPNIGYLFMSDEKGLSYNTVSWSEAGDSSATSLRNWLTNHLNSIASKTK